MLGRRSLYICAPIKAGEIVSRENVKSVRPSLGLHPKHLHDVLGRRVKRDLVPGDRLSWDVLE
jgi:pseudaminic acid synthase